MWMQQASCINSSCHLHVPFGFYMATTSAVFRCFIVVVLFMKGVWSLRTSGEVLMKAAWRPHEGRMKSPWRLLWFQTSRLHWPFDFMSLNFSPCVIKSTSTRFCTHRSPSDRIEDWLHIRSFTTSVPMPLSYLIRFVIRLLECQVLHG